MLDNPPSTFGKRHDPESAQLLVWFQNGCAQSETDRTWRGPLLEIGQSSELAWASVGRRCLLPAWIMLKACFQHDADPSRSPRAMTLDVTPPPLALPFAQHFEELLSQSSQRLTAISR